MAAKKKPLQLPGESPPAKKKATPAEVERVERLAAQARARREDPTGRRAHELAAEKARAGQAKETAQIVDVEPDDVEYASVRVIHDIGVRLPGSNGKSLTSGGGRRIVFRAWPYDHFLVLPEGHEIGLNNVASAIQVKASAANKLRRTPAFPEKRPDSPSKLAMLMSRATRTKPPAIAETEVLDEDENAED